MASVEMIQGSPMVVKCLEHTTSGNFGAGDLVKLASTGQIQIATSGLIFGIARRDAVGTANTVHEVELISPDAVYSARYKAANTSQSLQGDVVDFTFTTAANGGHTLDEGSATTDAYVVGFDSRDAVGANGGRLLIRFLSANTYGIGQF